MTLSKSDSLPRMTAADLKDALRRRHPAEAQGSMVGQWTCIEEWCEIDLLAIDAWSKAALVGYEVKVSRSDYRQEILRPAKRADAVAMCTEFYFAVPAGLLKPEEIAYDTPDWQPEDFERMRCPGIPTFGPPDRHATRHHLQRDLLDRPPGRYGGPCHGRGWTGSYKAGTREKGPFTVPLPLPLVPTDPPDYVTTKWERIEGTANEHGAYMTQRVPLEGDALTKAVTDWAQHHVRLEERAVACPTCDGKGYIDKSRVEAEAPTLWVPRDVGLIEITGHGCRVVRKAPKRHDAHGLMGGRFASLEPRAQRQALGQLVRWVSNRPDPRHLPLERQEAAA